MLIAALLMGFFGSLHCIGMCGPIALALPYGRFGGIKSFFARIIYQSGRLSTYAIIGLILGSLGMSLQFVSGQQFMSIVLGITLLFSVFVPMILKSKIRIAQMEAFNDRIRNSFSRWIQIDSYGAFYFSGFLNGLLPCGLVWIALASALALGNGFDSSMFMLFFGLGTLPAMLGTLFSFQLLKKRFSFSFNKFGRLITICLGIILIVRGLNMGNHLSPYFDFDEAKRQIITVCGLDH